MNTQGAFPPWQRPPLLCQPLRAVLDVVDPNPLPPGHALWTMPGVLITPHIGGIGTMASWRKRAYAVVREQLTHVVRGGLPPNLVVNGY